MVQSARAEPLLQDPVSVQSAHNWKADLVAPTIGSNGEALANGCKQHQRHRSVSLCLALVSVECRLRA